VLAARAVRPSALSCHASGEGGSRARLTLFQRNLERAVRSRAELVEEVAHAIAHELGHPERATA
jgi:predicted Zn-dependent protease with MMP-like domain